MGKIISLQLMPDRLLQLLENRYAGFAEWEAFRLGDYRIVLEHFSLRSCTEPSSPVSAKSLEILAMCHYYEGEYSKVVNLLEAVTCSYSSHPICQVFYGECVGRAGNTTLAMDVLVSIRVANKDNAELLMFLAGSMEQLGCHTDALQTASLACRIDPYTGQYLSDLSFYNYRVNGLSPGVLALARQAVSLEPDVIAFRVWLATILIASGKMFEAYEVMQDATEEELLTIDCPCCIQRIGNLYLAADDMDGYEICKRAFADLENRVQMERSKRRRNFDSRIPSTVAGLYSMETAR